MYIYITYIYICIMYIYIQHMYIYIHEHEAIHNEKGSLIKEKRSVPPSRSRVFLSARSQLDRISPKCYSSRCWIKGTWDYLDREVVALPSNPKKMTTRTASFEIETPKRVQSPLLGREFVLNDIYFETTTTIKVVSNFQVKHMLVKIGYLSSSTFP